MKLRKSLLAILLAFALIGTAACNVADGDKDGGSGTTTHSLTLNLNGGLLHDGDNITSFKEGEKVKLPTPYWEDGSCVFGGWFNNSECTGSIYSVINATETDHDWEFWAKWTVSGSQQTYSVTLNLNGGEFVNPASNITSYTEGKAVTLPTAEDVRKDNCTFGGWFENSDCTGNSVTEISAAAQGNKEYWAKWNENVPITHSVTLNLNGGEFINPASNITSYTEGTAVTLPTAADVRKDNCTFGGWFENSECTGNSVTEIPANAKGDKKYWAKWNENAPIMHSVTLNLNGGEFINPASNITSYTEGTAVALPTAADVKKDNCTFGGWYENSGCTGNAVSEIPSSAKGDKEYWAKWNENAPNAHSVTLNLNGGEFVNPASNITSYTEGTAVTLPTAQDVKKEHYTFGGWYETSACTGTAVSEIPATAKDNKEYWAKWIPVEYTVKFVYGNGTSDKDVKVEYGKTVAQPTAPERTGYEFKGWFTSLNGGEQYNFTQSVSGNLTLYARWQAKSYTVTLNLNGGSFKDPSYNVTSYTYGTVKDLPTVDMLEYTNHTFDGWYENSSFGGSRILSIAETETGNKEYWAKWSAIEVEEGLKILNKGGYDEAAFAEVNLLANTTASDYSATYSGTTSGKIDSELIRVVDNTKVRIDVVGLPKGTYNIQITAKNNTVSASGITVTAYDRSGYAHFNSNEGVGAYNMDGTPKNNAIIVYVTEATKNSVKAQINGKSYTGLVNILSNSYKDDAPLIVRILGTIGAPTWKEINYDKGGNYNDGKDYDGNNHLPTEKVIGKNNKQLPTDSSKLTQAELIKGGYNELDTSVYKELDGLTSKATYSSGEYDSAWNNCSLSGLSNVTVEGIGTDARIFQWGFTWKNCNGIEVRNLTFEDYTEDACSFEGGSDSNDVDKFDSKRIWVHHNTFLEGKNYWDVCPEQDKHEGDGATDFKKCSYITISYNHYFENHKTGLIGGGDTQTTANVTFHHNWYEHCNSRLPLARQANMHMYNNYYDHSTGTNMSIRAGAYAFIEYCYFDNANNPIEIKTGDIRTGAVKLFNCTFVGKSYSKNSNIHETTDRTAQFENDNRYNQYFDTDPNAFYYDSQNKKSGVTSLITDVTKVPEEIKKVSGVHK